MYKLYKITNLINRKTYIGFTKLEVEERLAIHLSTAKNPKYPVQYAFAKYGVENFIIETLCIGPTKEYISILEQPVIELYESHVTQNGYNVANGGCGGDLGEVVNSKRRKTIATRSPERKAKLAQDQRERQLGKTKETDAGRLAQSIAVTGNKFAEGHKHTNKTKDLIAATHKDKPKSQKTRQRMAKAAIINHNGKRFNGRNACCLCCTREWDIGNYTQHMKRKTNEF